MQCAQTTASLWHLLCCKWGRRRKDLLMEIMQTGLLETEYIMTLCAEMDPPQRIDETLSIFNVTGGWAKGPKINATVIQLAADWIQSMPDDSRRLDVPLTLKTDDGAL